MSQISKLIAILICVFIVSFKCTSAAAFVQNGIERVQKINSASPINFSVSKLSNQDVKPGNGFQFSSHVLGYLLPYSQSAFQDAEVGAIEFLSRSDPHLEILSSRIFRPPRTIA